MNRLNISTRLLLLIGLLAAILVAIGALGLVGIGKSNDALKSVYEDRTVPTGQLGEVRDQLLRARLDTAAALNTPTPAFIAERTAKVETSLASAAKVWDAYATTRMTEAEDKLAKAFVADRNAFLRDGLNPTLAALRANDLKETGRLLTERVRPLYAPVEHDIGSLVKLQLDEAAKEYTEAAARYAAIRMISIGSIALGLLLSGLFGWLITRSITVPMNRAKDAAARVAEGDLTVDLRVEGRDEVAQLLAALSDMKDNLTRIVGDVRQNAEGVASASAQIAQGNNDLSQRTEEQASALEETAASMEQLNSTVKQNADNAMQANQLALRASSVAIEGGDVVGQVVETMRGINDSSKKIADIIGVIDSIAFQTNILALNAAVEAARAGEQGRGFAVVASEVRSLAGRSADAAKEIKSLITASVERVEQGTALVGQAGVTMTEVVDSIKRVTDIMGEISAASMEQSAGVAQVGEAVTQMDQTTQQNAALVEESAAAAESLKQQAQQLVQAVAVFKLSHGGQAVAAMPAAASQAAPASPVGVERRSPLRAKNVVRLSVQPTALAEAANGDHQAETTRKSGTNDGWATF